MPALRLLTAGEAFEDLVFVGLNKLPCAGEEEKTNTFHATIGGGAVITAVGAARLGVATSVLSALSVSAAARLKREGVRVTNLRRTHEPHAVTAVLSTVSDRAFVTFNGVNATLEPRLLASLAGIRGTHVHLALCPSRLIAWTRLVTRLRRAGLTVSWDFGWNEALAARPELPALMEAVDVVFLNEREALLYARAASLTNACAVLRRLRSAAIVKLGAAGSRWLRAEGDLEVAAPRVKAVDTTGAGDAFNAGFLVAWLRGGTPAQCLGHGNAIGAASTRAAGGLDGLPRSSRLIRRTRTSS